MFKPIFSITIPLSQLLIRLEELRHDIQNLPVTPTVLASLRESARLRTVHFSTYIEGNRLTIEQVEELVKGGSTFPGRKRDEAEILGYYAALEQVKMLSSRSRSMSEKDVQMLHGLVMGGGKVSITPTPYRDGQNAIYDGASRSIVYLPPEAHDVPGLMADLVAWIVQSEQDQLPCPLLAAIAHYQFATIHPYYDGNGRTARLLATLLLHRGGYDLKGLYSLEEYYAKNLPAYYNALSVGPSHNYYMGRAEADITSWLDYFCRGMLDSFEKIKTHALIAYNKGFEDTSNELRDLDARQQAVLSLFKKSKIISSRDVQTFFALSARVARELCHKWLKDGFLVLKDPAKKSRTYMLHPEIEKKLFG
jgi:Fic family protein